MTTHSHCGIKDRSFSLQKLLTHSMEMLISNKAHNVDAGTARLEWAAGFYIVIRHDSRRWTPVSVVLARHRRPRRCGSRRSSHPVPVPRTCKVLQRAARSTLTKHVTLKPKQAGPQYHKLQTTTARPAKAAHRPPHHPCPWRNALLTPLATPNPATALSFRRVRLSNLSLPWGSWESMSGPRAGE